jgi:hypothetical protein
MKQFIVLLALLPLLLGLIMQVGQAQGNFALTVRAESIVRDAREAAAGAGGFDADIRAEMAARLAAVAGVAPGDVSVEADAAPDGDGELRYRVAVPVRRLVAAPAIFGIKPSENAGVYTIEGKVTVHRQDAEDETESGSKYDGV